MALERPAEISLDNWLRDDAALLPGGSFVALANGETSGSSGSSTTTTPGSPRTG